MAQICLKNNSVFCDIPFCYARQSFRDDKPMFGNADAEKQKFRPGKVSIENSVNFIKSYFEVTRYLDNENSCNLTELVEIRKEYYLKFQSIIYNSKAPSSAAKTKEAEFRVPELDYIRKVLAQFTELRKDVRSQISYWKTQEESL